MSEASSSLVVEAILARLGNVIDPETSIDVIRMRLIEDLSVDHEGNAAYTFRPSSPLCPIAVSLAIQIKQAAAKVPGVTSQEICIKDYIAKEELTRLINMEE
ncbi:MAG: iron-sulfur cluster assembly protein [Anaerolineales bacterium]